VKKSVIYPCAVVRTKCRTRTVLSRSAEKKTVVLQRCQSGNRTVPNRFAKKPQSPAAHKSPSHRGFTSPMEGGTSVTDGFTSATEGLTSPKQKVGFKPSTEKQSSPGARAHQHAVKKNMFRESPVHTTCTHCLADVTTVISYKVGRTACCICCLSLVCCAWPVWCFICSSPFCDDDFKDVIHSCPNCQHQLARWSELY